MRKEETKKALEFTIPARYYSRGSVDWDGPVPAKGYNGEKVKHITLSTANTAIMGVHLGNAGYPGGVFWTGEPGVEAYYNTWIVREKVVIEEHIAPLLDAARKAGLRILYVVGEKWPSVVNSPQFQRVVSRTKRAPEWEPPEPPVKSPTGWRKERVQDVLGKDFKQHGVDDFAPPVAAHPEDWFVSDFRGAQSSILLSENGIWNILLTGFEGASCFVWFGVLPMARLRYRCFIVEDCSLCLATRETRENEEIKKATFKVMQLTRNCYIVNGKDVIEGLAKAQREVE